MSKYTRLNKINHYHDSGSSEASQPILANLTVPTKQTNSLATDRSMMNSINSTLLHNSNNNKMKVYSNNIIIVDRSSRKMDHHLKNRNTNLNNSIQFKLAFIAVISIFLLLLVSIDGAYSLNCYHCSSVDNPECDEAFVGRANFTDTDCEKHIGRPAKVCRKIVQYIEHKKVVIRSCGYIDEHGEKERKSMCFKRSGTFAIMMESCICYEDNCNHSATLVPNLSVLLVLASCSLVIFYYNHLIDRRCEPQSILGKTRR